MPQHITAMLRAEVAAVFGRASARVALVASVIIPIGAAVVVNGVHAVGVNFSVQDGMSLGDMIDLSPSGLAGYSLQMRNIVVMPLLLVLVTAASVAGERRDHTLREVLVRPVPRWSVVAAKAGAVGVLSVCSLVASLLFSLLVAILFGVLLDWSSFTLEPWGRVCLGYMVCLFTDLGLIGMAMLVSSLLSSVGGVVVLMILWMMGDVALRGLLNFAPQLGQGSGPVSGLLVEYGPAVAQMLPGSALGAWDGWASGFDTSALVGLGVLIVVVYGLTCLRFQRMDVP